MEMSMRTRTKQQLASGKPVDETKEESSVFDAQLSAGLIAREAYTTNFSSRRGIGPWTDNGGKTIGFYVYDNNPWSHDRGLRDRLYAELIAALARRHCSLVSYGHYPTTGDSAGYTLALVFVSASPEQVPADEQAARDLYSQTSHFDVRVGHVDTDA
jgi:hypothetical protein